MSEPVPASAQPEPAPAGERATSSWTARLRAHLRAAWWVWALALTLAACDALAQELRDGRTPRGLVATGIPSRDMAIYTAWTQAYLERGTWLTHPNPFAPDAAADPAIHSRLTFVVMGWALRALGSEERLWRALPFLFGVPALLALWALTGALGLERRARVALVLWSALGAGWAWAVGLAGWGLDALARPALGRNLAAPLLASGIEELAQNPLLSTAAHPFRRYWLLGEHPHLWWNTTLFRVFFGPADLLNHAVLFLAFAALARGRARAGLALVALTFWVHPAAGVSAVGATLFLALLELRWGERRVGLLLGAGGLLIGVVGVGFHVLAERAGQGYDPGSGAAPLYTSMRLVGALTAFGPPLLLIGLGLRRAGPRALVAERPSRLLAAWVAAEASLVWGLPLLPGAEVLQPLHYARGVFYTGLAALAVKLLAAQPDPQATLPPAWRARATGWLTLLLCLHAGDNLLYLREYANEPAPAGFVITSEQARLVQWLEARPAREVVLAVDDAPTPVALAIDALTRHRAAGRLRFPGMSGLEPELNRARAFLAAPDATWPAEVEASLIVVPPATWQRAGRPAPLVDLGQHVVVARESWEQALGGR